MNFSLKPHQLVAHWVPGFVVVFFSAYIIGLTCNLSISLLLQTGPLFLLAVAAFIVGQIIDAIRSHWLEGYWDKKCKVNWDFFFLCQDTQLENLDNFFYVYYVFDVNILIAFVLSGIIFIIGMLANNTMVVSVICQASLWEWSAFILVTALVFTLYRDAKELREYLAKFTNPPEEPPDMQDLPHKGVYTRLKPSKIHKDGVGVFAIRYIPKGTEIFAEDDSEVVWLEAPKIKELPINIRQLYEDFCVIKDSERRYGCPKNFNCLTIGWHLNHSKTPNVECDETFIFFAKQDIPEGDELTVDYDTFNDWIERPDYL